MFFARSVWTTFSLCLQAFRSDPDHSGHRAGHRGLFPVEQEQTGWRGLGDRVPHHRPVLPRRRSPSRLRWRVRQKSAGPPARFYCDPSADARFCCCVVCCTRSRTVPCDPAAIVKQETLKRKLNRKCGACTGLVTGECGNQQCVTVFALVFDTFQVQSVLQLQAEHHRRLRCSRDAGGHHCLHIHWPVGSQSHPQVREPCR